MEKHRLYNLWENRVTQESPTSENAQCPDHSLQSSCGTQARPNDHIETSKTEFFPCDFAEAGCQALISQIDYLHHMKENFSHHHLLVSQLNLKITKEIQLKLDFEKDSALRQEVRQLQRVLAEKDAECIRLQVEVSMLRKQISKGNESVCYGERSGDSAAGTFDQNYDKLENIVKVIKNAPINTTLPLRGDEEFVPRYVEVPGKTDMSIPQQHGLQLGKSDINTNSDPIASVLFDKPERNPDNTAPVYTPREGKMYNERSEVLVPRRHENVLQHGRNTATRQDSTLPMTFVNAPSGHGPLEGTNYRFFLGVQERVLIKGLNQAWGLAISGDVIFVADANRKSGVVQRVSLDGLTNAAVPGINLRTPRGLALDRNMNVIIVDSGAHQIFKFTHEGILLAACGEFGSGDGEFKGPIGVAVDAIGRIFVCDRLNHRIQVLDENLVFINMFGEMGTGILQFSYPWDVAFDSQGNIYIADCGNCCVKVFTPYMTHLRIIGRGQLKYKDGDLRAPSSVFLDRHDNLYVTDRGLSCVLVYDNRGLYITSFGNFVEPNALCVDASGYVYVSENGSKGKFNGSGRVTVYT